MSSRRTTKPFGEGGERGNPYVLGVNVKQHNHHEIVNASPKAKQNFLSPSFTALSIHPKGSKSNLRVTGMSMFIVSVFTITRQWNQAMCP